MATPARAEAAAILPELLINSRREVRLVGLWFIGYIFSTQTSGCQFEKSGPAHQSHQWLRSRSRLTTGDTADYQSALRGSADCQSAVSRTGSPHEPALCQWPFGPRTTDDTTTLPLVDSLSPRRRSGERVREKGFQFAAPIRRKEPLSPALSPLVPRGEREQGASMMVVVIRSKRVLKTDNLWLPGRVFAAQATLHAKPRSMLE